ncbi:MAG: autotransporter-associated beta strand repeat-containing protein, partial [Chthoniobacterales bacterium]
MSFFGNFLRKFVDSSLYRRSVILLLAEISILSAHALTIQGYTPEADNRFSSGFSSAPIANADPSYIGAGYDLSGVGWLANSGVTNRLENVTMITPVNFAAGGLTISVGDQFNFASSTGQVLTATTGAINSSLMNSNAMGTFTQAFTPDQNVTVYRFLDVATRTYTGMDMLIYGSQADNAGPRIGNAVSQADTPASRVTWAGTGQVNGAITAESGDNGSPGFFKYTAPDGTTSLMLAGTSQGGNLLASWIPRSSNNPMAGFNSIAAASGYALKWTIYDNPADPTRTAPVWTGGAATGDLNTTGNWSSNASPSDLPVIFDSSTAAGQTALTIAADTSLRGMLFKANASPVGFTFDGTNTLSIGTTGIRNESTATQIFNTPIMVNGSQNWEAANGDLQFNGDINDFSSSTMLVVGGAHDTVINGVVFGNGALSKDDTGTLTINAVNTNVWTTFIHNGTIRLGAGGNIGTGFLAFVAANDARLDLNGRDQTVRGIYSDKGGVGTILLGGGTLTINTTSTVAAPFSGSIQGNGNLVKTGSDVQALSGNNTYTGTTSIYYGKLRLLSSNALPSGNLILQGGILELGAEDFTRALGTGTNQVQFNSTLPLNGGNSRSSGFSAYGANRIVNLGGASAPVTWGVGNFLADNRNFSLGSASSGVALDFQNPIDLGAAGFGYREIDIPSGKAIISGGITYSGGNTSDGVTLRSTGILDVTGNIAIGVAAVQLDGGGQVIFSGNNSYTGQTQLGGGVLRLASAQALPATSNLSISGGVLELANGDFTRALGSGAGQVQVGGGGFSAYGANRIVNLGGASAPLIWGSGFLSSNTFSLSSSYSNATVDFQNPLDIRGGIPSDPRHINVSNGSADTDAILSGAITNSTGSFYLFKNGSGSLLVSGPVTISGSGTHRIEAGAGSITFSGGINFAGSGTDILQLAGSGIATVTSNFDIGNAQLIAAGISNNWTFSGDTTKAGKISVTSGTLNISGNIVSPLIDITSASLNLSGTSDTTLDGIVSGSGSSLVKSNGGSVTINGVNTFSGRTIITNGTVRMGTGSLAFSRIDFDGDSRGILDLNNRDNTFGQIYSDATGAGVINLGTGTLTVNTSDSAIQPFSGTIQGSGGIIKNGTGGEIFSGANTYSGVTTINGGSLVIRNALALGSTAAGTVVNSGGTLSLGSNVGKVAGETLAINGGTLNSSGTSNEWAAPVTLTGTGNQTSKIASSSGSLLISGPVNFSGTSTDTFELSGNSSGQISGATNLSASTLLKTGTGTWTLSNAMTLSGSGTHSIISNAGSLTVSGNVHLTNDAADIFELGGTSNGTISGNIDGDSQFLKSGTGKWILSGNNTYTGGTIISAGTLQIGAGGTASSITGNVTDDATLSFNRGGSLTHSGVISGTGAVT